MAKKKPSAKAVKEKVNKIIKTDAFAAVTIVSLVINAFFLTGFVYYNSTSALDESVYNLAFDNYCNNRYAKNLEKAIEDSNDEALAMAKFEIKCLNGDFADYHTDTVEQYLEDKGF